MRIINILLLLFLVATLLIGNTIYESDLENREFRDIQNYTSKIDWDFNYTLEEPENSEDIIHSRLRNIIYKFIDFIGFSSFEILKTGVEFGYENPQFDYNFAFDILKLFIILWMVALIIPIIIPFIAIITILGMGIYSLIKRIREKKIHSSKQEGGE